MRQAQCTANPVNLFQPQAMTAPCHDSRRTSDVQASVIDQPNLPDRIEDTGESLDYRHASEDELLKAARNSDGCAFAELSGRYASSIHKRIFRLVRNREDTEDVMQEALYKAYVHLSCFRGSCGFSTWLTRIAINSAFMLLRKRRSHSEVSYDQPVGEERGWEMWEFPDPSPNAEELYARQQAVELMSRAVKRLPPCYRGVLEQFHGQEQSLQQAADKLGISVAAAKSRLLRARLSMRSTLGRLRISTADAC